MEVDSLAGVEGHAGEQVGDAVLALGPQAGDGLRLGHAGRDRLADDPLEDDVGGVAEDLGAYHGERHAHHREQHDDDEERALIPELAGEPAQRAADVPGLRGRHHEGVGARATGAGSAGAARRLGRSAGSRLLRFVLLVAHATPSTPSCEVTISR
jgi:hypothetical protein